MFDVPVIIAVLGAILIIGSLFGGGIQIQQIKFPELPGRSRPISGLIGVVFIIVSAWMWSQNILTGTVASPLPTVSSAPTIPADKRCQGEEKGAVINGTPMPVTDWQADCAYRPKLRGGEKITLTTWGIIHQYADKDIVSAKIIAPRVEIIIPLNATLFAGYQSREGVEQAYRATNPNAPTPIP